MNLPTSLIKEFASIVTPSEEAKKETSAYGTVTVNETGTYVRFDGSTVLTPAVVATGVENGDRVLATIKNHSAIITGNITSPVFNYGNKLIWDGKELTVIGNIKSTSGDIGGFTIADKYLYCSTTIDGVVYRARLEKNSGSTTNHFWQVRVGGVNKAYVRYDGYFYAENANIKGTINADSLTAKNTYYIHNSSGTKKEALTAPDGSFGSSLVIGNGFSACYLHGSVITGGNLFVLEDGTGTITCGLINSTNRISTNTGFTVETSGATNAYLIVKNGSRTGYIGASSGYNLGIYDGTNNNWVIYSGTNQTVNIPHPLSVTGNSNLATVTTYNGNYKPVGSIDTNGRRVAYLGSRGSGSTKTFRVSGQWSDDASATTYSTQSITVASSDVRLKENIRATEVDALAVVNKIKMRQFDWKETGVHQNIGVVADELEQLDSKFAVGGGFDENGNMDVKVVDTFYLACYLLKAVQELHQELLALRQLIK